MKNKYFKVLPRSKIALITLIYLLPLAPSSFGISEEGQNLLEKLHKTLEEYTQPLGHATAFSPFDGDIPSAQYNHILDYTHIQNHDGTLTVRAITLPEPTSMNPEDMIFIGRLRQIFLNVLFAHDNELSEIWNQLIFRIEWLTEGTHDVTLQEVIDAWIEFLDFEMDEPIENTAAAFVHRHQLYNTPPTVPPLLVMAHMALFCSLF
tara:strand:+ start:1975 stop:2592 length:618 start_codon:yes stop_codon:yes gene_type:complete